MLRVFKVQTLDHCGKYGFINKLNNRADVMEEMLGNFMTPLHNECDRKNVSAIKIWAKSVVQFYVNFYLRQSGRHTHPHTKQQFKLKNMLKLIEYKTFHVI